MATVLFSRISIYDHGLLMRHSLSLAQKGLLAVSVILVLEMVFVGVLLNLLHRADAQLDREQHTQTVIYHLNRQANLFQRLTVDFIRFVVTQNPHTTPRSLEYIRQLSLEFQALKELLKDEPEQKKAVEELQITLGQGIDIMDRCRKAWFDQERMLHLSLCRQMHTISDICTVKSDSILDGFMRRQAQNREERDQLRKLVQAWVIVGLVSNVALCISLALLFTRAITRRLGVIAQNSTRLAIGQPLLQSLGGDDELARVDHSFHEMAEVLESARQKERAVLENAKDVICSIDADDRFQAVSAAALPNWGYAPDDLIGTRYITLIPEDERERTRAAMHEIVTNQSIIPLETRVIRKDGELIDVLWSAHWSKQEQSLFCVTHDITERKRAEELLKLSEERVRSIIENLPVGVVIVNPLGVIESINPRIMRLFDCNRADAVGCDISKLINLHQSILPVSASVSSSTGDSNSASTDFKKLKEAAYGRVVEGEGRRGSGGNENIFPVEISMTKFQTTEGERYLVNIQDISERREIENKKQEFVAMVSHDLRTPLSTISGALALIAADRIDVHSEAGKKRVDAAQENVTRLITLVNDLLDVEKLGSGTMAMDLDCADLSYIIEKSVEAVRGVAEKQNVEVVGHPTTLQVIADHDRCIQALTNLLSNAIKFSPEGAPVNVVAEQKDGSALVKVIDLGRGIPKNFLGAIFERFKQVNSADGKRGTGTGLGLAITKAIIEGHGGEIGVDSEVGKGSTFWFRIPLADPEALDND